MSAFAVIGLLNQIASESSRLKKESLLGDLMGYELGRFAVKWAYDPFVTFGLTPVRQDGDGSGLKLDLRPQLIEGLLNELAQRKLTGNAAQREVAEVMMALNTDSRELLFRILSKDLKCGIAATTINTVEPGFIPTFAVMRAHKFEEKRIKTWPQIVEPKLDGYRFTFLCRNGSGGFFSRSGIRQPAAEHLVEPMIATALNALTVAKNKCSEMLVETLAGDLRSATLDGWRGNLNFMVDGEMIVDGSFAETGALRRKDETADGAVFHVFDLMSYADFDAVGSTGKAYMTRRKLVEEFVGYAVEPVIKMTPRYFVNSIGEIHQLYENFRARGLEGAMVKKPDGLYDKKKSYGWLKIKAEESEDLSIIGAYPGEPNTKYENCLGGLVVRRANGVKVRVGGGISDDQRIELWKSFQEDLAKANQDLVVHDKDEIILADAVDPATTKLIFRLIEVLYHEETPDGSLRHPRMKCFRDDKANEIEKAA